MKSRLAATLPRIVTPVSALVVSIVAWDVGVRVFSISEMILPGPWQVFLAIKDHFLHLAWQGAITLSESVLGFVVGGFAAIALAVLFQFSRTAETAIYPYAIAIKAVPLVALAPLVVVWCGTGLLSKVVLAAIISFFPILVSTVQGLAAVENEALDLMNTLSASKWQVVVKVRFPTALPSIFAGMKISSTFAVVGAVVAEFVGSKHGIGNVIKTSSYYLDSDISFAAIIVTALLSLLLFATVCLVERKVIFWRESDHLVADPSPFERDQRPHDPQGQ